MTIVSKPFPSSHGRSLHDWARLVLWLWAKAGHPFLLGVPAEQVHYAREILGIRG